jgi:hypothetical protein
MRRSNTFDHFNEELKNLMSGEPARFLRASSMQNRNLTREIGEQFTVSSEWK